MDKQIFGSGEKAMFELRALYHRYGYEQYRVSRFEEYDLYAQNKSFLTGKHILTFTDTNGQLMALKPDITLSIIKNTVAGNPFMHKVYYSENVYRAQDALSGFREIPQTGLECIGPLDLYSISEVVMLAAESLKTISPEYILDVSHIGIVSDLLESMKLSPADEAELLRLISGKNAHEVSALCRRCRVPEELTDKLSTLIKLYAPLKAALSDIAKLELGEKAAAAVKELTNVADVLEGFGIGNRIFFDFSLLSDTDYYNGVIFRGFIDGIPSGILSGGQYDGLMEKMGKDTGAIGFAVYLDLLERLNDSENEYDADTLVIYDDGSDVSDVLKKAYQLISNGETVRVDKSIPKGFKYKNLVRILKGNADE